MSLIKLNYSFICPLFVKIFCPFLRTKASSRAVCAISNTMATIVVIKNPLIFSRLRLGIPEQLSNCKRSLGRCVQAVTDCTPNSTYARTHIGKQF